MGRASKESAFGSGKVARAGRCIALVFLLLFTVAAVADVPATPAETSFGFKRFKHTRWTADEGAPSGISSITQTSDGFLWIAASAGLVRFDGVTFERVPPPAGSPMERAEPTKLLVSRKGELWVGYANSGGVAVLRDGRLQNMAMPKPPPSISGLAETPDGAVWAVHGGWENRVWRLSDGRWEQVDERLRLPAGQLTSPEVDGNGTLWTALVQPEAQSAQLLYLPLHDDRFRISAERITNRPAMKVAPDGKLWIADQYGIRVPARHVGKPFGRPDGFQLAPKARSVVLEFDGKGGVWGAALGGGAVYSPGPLNAGERSYPQVARFRATDGFTSDIAFAVYADREGNVWFGTDLGLDQFRPADIVPEPTIVHDPAEGMMIDRANDGTVYVMAPQRIYAVSPGRRPRPVLDSGAYVICAARKEGLWVIHPERLIHVHGERQESFPTYPFKSQPANCAEDRFGRLWVGLADLTMMQRDSGGWHPPRGPLSHTPVWDLIATPDGDIAFTTPEDLVIARGDRMAAIRLAPYELRRVAMIQAGTRDIFLRGNGMLARFRDGRLQRLDGRRYPWLAKIRSLVQTPSGDTWMTSEAGVHKVRTADLDRAFDDHGPLPVRTLDSRDGLVSGAQHTGYTGIQAVLGGDGRLWFLNRFGASFVDTARLTRNRLAPNVLIRSLSARGRTWSDPRSIVLPPGTRSLEIAYAALSMAVPQRVRFRYRLEGVDEGWVDPGARRLASYANLGPGRYRFQVVAANNDGVWNRKGAALEFEIRPTFFQSWIFRGLCGIALAGLLWLAYSLRLRAVANRIRLRITERMDERERIARELHDTLLQSVQALTLSVQLAVDELPAQEPARPALEGALDRADRVIAEGRDRVRELRPFQGPNDVAQMVADTLETHALDPEARVTVATSGSPRPLDPLVLDELNRIVGEAIFNIQRHARARSVTIDIEFHANFRMRFADDGIGIDPAVLAKGGREGHFGLPGMRERARKLHGDLLVRPLAQGGTEVVLTVPGRVAYRGGRLAMLRHAAGQWFRRRAVPSQ
ncbi:sensor histidine kinase [Novosphingobium kaempferiae]|uniref:sensor histidine kinase n=1 Tax=Novosphingobium kaempferiae TaxID=2896849 RepID=UPI001E4CFB06|nr:sensor histidine kinase [Novosphingobium kaempferiae]